MNIENNTDNWKKYQSNHFYFVGEDPAGRGSEYIKKECNVNYLDFSSFPSL